MQLPRPLSEPGLALGLAIGSPPQSENPGRFPLRWHRGATPLVVHVQHEKCTVRSFRRPLGHLDGAGARDYHRLPMGLPCGCAALARGIQIQAGGCAGYRAGPAAKHAAAPRQLRVSKTTGSRRQPPDTAHAQECMCMRIWGHCRHLAPFVCGPDRPSGGPTPIDSKGSFSIKLG